MTIFNCQISDLLLGCGILFVGYLWLCLCLFVLFVAFGNKQARKDMSHILDLVTNTNFPDDDALAEINQLEDKLAADAKIGRVDPEDRQRYEELCRKYNWGEKLSEDD